MTVKEVLREITIKTGKVIKPSNLVGFRDLYLIKGLDYDAMLNKQGKEIPKLFFYNQSTIDKLIELISSAKNHKDIAKRLRDEKYKFQRKH